MPASTPKSARAKGAAKHYNMMLGLPAVSIPVPLYIFWLLLLACVVQVSSSPCNPCEIHVTSDPHTGRLSASPSTKPLPSLSIVWARYYATYEQEGWDRLEISAVPDVPVSDSIKAAAAGYAEGHLHASRVYDYWTNYR